MRTTFFILALLMLTACGGSDTSEEYVARAKEYIAEAEYPSAAIELQNALKLDGTAAEARWLLGKIYLDRADILAAEKELQRAQELGWKADDVRPALAKTLLAQGKFADVLKLEIQDLNTAAAAQLLVSQAYAQLAEGQVEKARELVVLALGKEPQSQEAKLAQATIFMQERDPTAALPLLDAILEVVPENGAAWRLKGEALLMLRRFEEARAAYDKRIALSPEEQTFDDRTARALINVQLEDYKAAEAEVTELLELNSQDPAANYVLGLLRFQEKKYREAISALNLAVPVATKYPLSLYYLSLAYMIEKDIELAGNFAAQFVKLSPQNAVGRKLYAATLLQNGKVKEAQEILRSVVDNNPSDAGALNLLANALLLDDQADVALSLYARIPQIDPDWKIVPLRLEAELVAADPEGEMKQPAVTVPDKEANFPQTEMLQILNHLAKKEFPAAIEVAKSYQFRDPESLAPYKVLGRVYLAAGQPEEAAKAFEHVLKRAPDDTSASLNLAQLALVAGDNKTARNYYKSILSRHPDDLTTLLQMAALDAREKNAEAMLSRLKQAMDAHPTALEPRLRMAGYYLSTGSPAKVIPLFATLDELQRGSPAVLETTALAQLALQENADALLTLQLLVDTNSESAQYRYLLAMAASKTGDEKKSEEELAEANRLDPNHIPTLLALSRIALRDGEKQLFTQYLDTLVKLAPDTTDVLRMQALGQRQDGKAEEALALAQRAFEQSPNTQTVLELIAFQKAAGHEGDARVTMQQWMTDHPQDTAVRIALANDLEQGSNAPGAQAQYLAVLELEPENVSALNNLAWSLRIENSKQALAYAQRAIKLAPNVPAVLDTLAIVQYHMGDHQSARLNIQKALVGAPDNLSMQYHQAIIDVELGDKDKAITALQALLAKDAEEFPERVEAEKMLKKLQG